MQEDLEIDVWITEAKWCPNPESGREMQLDFRLVREGSRLLIVAPKNQILGALDQGLSNQLNHLHRAGADFDVDILDSIPESKMFLASIYVCGDEIENLSGKIAESKKLDRERKKKIKADAQAEIERKKQIKQAKRQRRRLLLAVSWRLAKAAGPLAYRVCISLKTSIRRWWNVLVEWTNKDPK